MKTSTFGERLRSFRKAAGINQSALGQQLGLSQDTVSLWEQDRSKPDFDSIIALCRIFDISADDLLGIEVN